jgi:hypothetical protein
MAKFPWGNDAVPIPVMCAIMLASAVGLGVVLATAGPADAVGDAFPSPVALHPTVVVTCVYLVMWYMFLGNQIGIKFTAGLPAVVEAEAKNIADRTVGNTLEQALPFLVLMWLEAIVVNPRTAMILGWFYVATRFFYPWFWGAFGQFNLLVELATQPNYIIIFYYLLTVFFKCVWEVDIHTKIDATSPWLMPLFMIACGMCSFICFLLLGGFSTKFIISGVKKNQGYEDDEYEYEDEE